MASETTKDEAIKFLESAVRNWSHVPRLSNDDIDDVRVALDRFRRAAVAELVELAERYGRHIMTCDITTGEGLDCTCGFEQARHQAGLGKGDDRG